jgi:hypothetical protein
MLPHEKSTDCHVGHKQLFLIIGRRKESTSQVILGAMYHSPNLLEHSRMHVQGSVSGSLTKNFPGVSVVMTITTQTHAEKEASCAHLSRQMWATKSTSLLEKQHSLCTKRNEPLWYRGHSRSETRPKEPS